jgi:hypothetical protein
VDVDFTGSELVKVGDGGERGKERREREMQEWEARVRCGELGRALEVSVE